MRATHGRGSCGQRAQQPVHFRRLQAHIDLDRRAAGDGGGHRTPQIVERGFAQFPLGDFKNLKDHFFDIARADAGRGGLHCHRAVAEGFGIETQGVELFGNTRIFQLLRRSQLNHQRHQQALRLDRIASTRGENLLEQNPFMGHVLIDDPESIATGSDDEAVVNLTHGAKIAQGVETGFIDVSDDGGASWTMHDGPAGVDSVYLSAVDPHDPDRVYLRSYFPQGSLYVSENGAETWSLIDESDVPLTGFALSPDGQQIAVGGTNGITVLTRTGGDGGSAFAVTTTSTLPVNCLTWTANGLFACADEATSGFTIGVSTDGARTFAPLLHLADLTPVSCAGDASVTSCAAQWCSTAMSIGASCAVKVDAASDAKSDGTGVVATSIAGCACDTVDTPRTPGILVAFALMTLRVRRQFRAAGATTTRSATKLGNYVRTD